jgi:Tfp pilus assembly protein PilN
MKRWKPRAVLNVVLASLLTAPLAWAQQMPTTDDLKREIGALREEIRALRKDMQDIKALLQKQQPTPPPQNVVLDLGKSPSKGERTARLTLVEFSDYQ